jgi:inorganic pyrophosphatase
MKHASPFDRLSARKDDTGLVNLIVDTPKGSRNKFRYDSDLGLFRLGKVLPLGMAFPYDFGFIPSTLAEDGDPLDVLLLADEPAFPGCLVGARLLGVFEAEQRKRARARATIGWSLLW